MFQYHLKKTFTFQLLLIDNLKISTYKYSRGKKTSVNLEQQRVLNWMFPKYCVFLSFGDVFKRHKSNPLDFQVQAYHFCASYQWCGEEREYIIQLHFGKKIYSISFLLPFCYISCLLTCTMVQSTAASGVTIARLCSNFYRKHANTV